jgi:hypothetical protein
MTGRRCIRRRDGCAERCVGGYAVVAITGYGASPGFSDPNGIFVRSSFGQRHTDEGGIYDRWKVCP